MNHLWSIGKGKLAARGLLRHHIPAFTMATFAQGRIRDGMALGREDSTEKTPPKLAPTMSPPREQRLPKALQHHSTTPNEIKSEGLNENMATNKALRRKHPKRLDWDNRWRNIKPSEYTKMRSSIKRLQHSRQVLNNESSTYARGCQVHPSSHHVFTKPTFDASKRIYHPAPPTLAKSSTPSSIIVLNCGTVELAFGREAICHLTAINYLSGTVLIDNTVSISSSERVTNWRTASTRLTAARMFRHDTQALALRGLEGARKELFQHIDSSSVIVGHGICKHLEALRICHSKILDFQVLCRQMRDRRILNLIDLETAVSEFLGMEIEGTCLDRAMAARELLIHWIRRNEYGRSKKDIRKQRARDQREDERVFCTPENYPTWFSCEHDKDGGMPSQFGEWGEKPWW
ncbi:hypothetical protein BJ508DRAFT_375229 [Ascobolus immersus RN42]|uniref:Exonuclease domain-containing protein n=1 Tax=Ascobolus immersus RN42 TaxID=1160509 RepID=A0A3N4IB13_ASCIM|nr:hypothetical protein BJ508DRAFT_375229 [Ascobolus immersus RN42]